MQVAGGDGGIVGSGLDDRSPPSTMERWFSRPPRVTVVEAVGDLVAFYQVVELEKILPSNGVQTAANGSARLQMPDGVVYEFGGDTRAEFKLEGGRWMPVLDRGTVRAPAKAPASTPMVSAIVCEGPWALTRNGAALTVTGCASGSVRWLPGTSLVPLGSSATLQVDEHGRRVVDAAHKAGG